MVQQLQYITFPIIQSNWYYFLFQSNSDIDPIELKCKPNT
jgi:hypothetical protein